MLLNVKFLQDNIYIRHVIYFLSFWDNCKELFIYFFLFCSISSLPITCLWWEGIWFKGTSCQGDHHLIMFYITVGVSNYINGYYLHCGQSLKKPLVSDNGQEGMGIKKLLFIFKYPQKPFWYTHFKDYPSKASYPSKLVRSVETD